MRIAMIVPALLLAVSASAQDFSYKYAEVTGSNSKNNDTDLVLDVASATASFQSEAGALLQLTAGLGEADDIFGFPGGGPEGDVRVLEAFVGGARQLTGKTSAWTGVGLGQTLIEPDNGPDIDRFTARFSLGLRHWLLPRVEGHATAGIVYFKDEDEDGVELEDGELRLGARFYALRNVSLNLEAAYQFDERVEIFGASLRYDY